MISADKNVQFFVRLGDFIRNGTGVCRHHALALKLALQEIGVPSRLVTGKAVPKNMKIEDVKVMHAWVVVRDEYGNEYILDPTYSNYGSTNIPFVEANTPELRTDLRPRVITDNKSKEDLAYHPLGYNSTQIPLPISRRFFPELVELIKSLVLN